MQRRVGEDLGVGRDVEGGGVFQVTAILHVPEKVRDGTVGVARGVDKVLGGVVAGDGCAAGFDRGCEDAVATA